MIKKTITFTDFDGVEKTKTFYFNLTQAEMSRMAIEEGWYLSDKVLEIARSKDVPRIVNILEDIVLRAYGERTADGGFLKKRPDGTRLADIFVTSMAYNEMYCEFIKEPEKFVEFVNSLVPADMNKQIEEMKAAHQLPAELEGMM